LRRLAWWEAEADVARPPAAGRVHRDPAGQLPVVPALPAEETSQAQWALRLGPAVARALRPERVSGKDGLVRPAADPVLQELALGAAAGPARWRVECQLRPVEPKEPGQNGAARPASRAAPVVSGAWPALTAAWVVRAAWPAWSKAAAASGAQLASPAVERADPVSRGAAPLAWQVAPRTQAAGPASQEARAVPGARPAWPEAPRVAGLVWPGAQEAGPASREARGVSGVRPAWLEAPMAPAARVVGSAWGAGSASQAVAPEPPQDVGAPDDRPFRPVLAAARAGSSQQVWGLLRCGALPAT